MTARVTVSRLCRDCAVGNGAVWPDGHLATVSPGHCDVCGEYDGLANVSDWNWPNRKSQGWHGSGRD